MKPVQSLAVVSAVAIFLAGCIQQGDGMQDEQQPGTSASEDVTAGDDTEQSTAPVEADLRASVTGSAEIATAPEGFTSGIEGVLVSYTVTNEGPEPIKVAQDRAASQARSATQAPAAAWVSAGSEEGVVRLSKQVFGIPEGVLPAALHRASSTTVEPGGAAEDTAFVPLPLRTDLPSGTETITVTEDPLSDPGSVTALEICVQIAPGPTPGQEEPFASTIAADAPGTALVCSDPIELPEPGR